jgi:hypothetical protein
MTSFHRRPHTALRPALLLAGALLLSLAPASALGAEQKVEDKTQFSVTAGSLAFTTSPAMPALTGVTLKGESQKTNTEMTPFGVSDATGSGSGWRVTVEGQSGSGKSAVFARYCPKPTCGGDSEGYPGGGATLAANSLTLSSTSASLTAEKETSGTAPELKCSSPCNVDSASATKIVDALAAAGMGTYKATGWGASSLTLTTPSTTKALPAEEVYRVNLLWTLITGP